MFRSILEYISEQLANYRYARRDFYFNSQRARQRLSCGKGCEVDHIVSLDEAWRSGADVWDPGKRRLFADDATNQWCISRKQNREKSSDTLATMSYETRALFTPQQIRRIAVSTLEIKKAYRLTISNAEKRALLDALNATKGVQPAPRNCCE